MQGALGVAPSSSERAGGPTDPSHDEALRRGIIATDVSRGLAWSLCVLFLAAIYGVPLSQAYLERRAEEESPLLDLFRRAPTAENLHSVEKGIEDASRTPCVAMKHPAVMPFAPGEKNQPPRRTHISFPRCNDERGQIAFGENAEE